MRVAWLALLLLACGTPAVHDDGGADSGTHDAGFTDAGSDDAGPGDAGSNVDAGLMDAGVTDAGVSDAGLSDAGVADAGMNDAGLSDAGVTDAGTPTLNGGDTCAMAPDVTAGGTYLGTTVGAQDYYGLGLQTNAGCPTGGPASGSDVTYLLNPIATTQYSVTVTPLNQQFDPLLYVQAAACGAGGCLAGTTLNGAGEPESVTFTVPGGTSAYIIVDGELGTSGSFEISIVAQ